ncbi:MAG: cyclophilin-like fold protein [Erysipelotrichaceae bacterium]|nr:cyclophilin-like fold protein [Erysipelotrichaceae bacterium]
MEMKVKISDEFGNEVIYKVHDDELSHAFCRMLPLTVVLQKSGSNEFSFVSPKKMNTYDACTAPGGVEALCYHQPWNEILIYYAGYSQYEDLYEIGVPISGNETARNLHGPVFIEEVLQ